MKNLRPFQIVLLAAFAVVGLISVIVLSNYSGLTGEEVNPYGEGVVIWGTFPQRTVDDVLFAIGDQDENFHVVRYVEKDSRTFEDELVNAIAEGRSPDGIILKHDSLVTYRPKLLAIPYETLSLRTFRDRYIDGAEIFALSDGVYALPLLVDPLVMYWNRDLFAKNGMPQPPSTWEALTSATQRITLRNAGRDILEATVAFGEYANVRNAGAVLALLAAQSGSTMVEETEEGYYVSLGDPVPGSERRPLDASLQFYVEFSNPNSPLYSWNRSWQDDHTAFLAEELALYFGFGSELPALRAGNPNFNFDVAPVPQGAGATILRGYGDFYGVAILNAAPNPQGAYAALTTLTEPEWTAELAGALSLAPVHRILLQNESPDPFRQVLHQAALLARGWLDPNPVATETIMAEMVESVVSNRQKISAATSDAVKRIKAAF